MKLIIATIFVMEFVILYFALHSFFSFFDLLYGILDTELID